MARGLLTGAFFLTVITLTMIVMVLWPKSPWSTWLMEKSELGDDFCWFGEGIWQTNLVWGSKKLHCDTHGTETKDALEFYCDSNFDVKKPFSGSICKYIRWARIFNVLGAMFSILGFLLLLIIQFTTSLQSRAIQTRRTLICQGFAFICYLLLFLTMTSSPLLDIHHFKYLGAHNQVNYRGMGCVFQSPFVGSILHLVTNSPLKCLYPGPALPLTIGIVFFDGMSCLLLYFLYRETVTSNELRDNSNANITYPCYSLHGAFMRKLSKFHRFEAYFTGILIPFLALGNGMLLISWFYHGMQFLVQVTVRVEDETDEFRFMKLREQIFTFDPVTSLKDFWEGKGYLISIITAVWLDFFPFFKIFIWLYYWFVPSSEILRGRVLTWIDYLGRLSLANLFVLCIISVGFMFRRVILIPLFFLPGGIAISVDLQVIVESGAGVVWFIISLFWTIALGNVFLWFHSLAKHWEEERRLNGSTSFIDAQQISFISFNGALTDDTPLNSPDVNNINNNSISSPPTFSRRESLIGEFVRRTSSHLQSVSRSTGPKESLSSRIFMPAPQLRVSFSLIGKSLIWAALFMVIALINVSLFVAPVYRIKRSGAVVDILINEKDDEYTLPQLFSAVERIGGSERPAKELAITYLIVGIIVPFLHSVGLLFLWAYPFTLVSQKQYFHLMELLDAWNALDVFFMACFMVWLGIESISKSVVETVIPGLTQFVREFIPQEHDCYVLTPEICAGFWVILAAIVFEKVLNHVLMEISAATIAQRESDETNHNREAVSQSQLLFLSPTARYASISGVSAETMYAGLPVWLWKLGLKLHLLEIRSNEFC